jgi:hypothetical protein
MEEEVDATAWPVHPAIAVTEPAFPAEGHLKVVQQGVKPVEILPSAHNRAADIDQLDARTWMFSRDI